MAFSASIFGEVGQRYFGRYMNGLIGTVKVTEKATVAVTGIGNIRESSLIQPDGVGVATLHYGAPNTCSQRADLTFVSGYFLDRQVVPPWAGSCSKAIQKRPSVSRAGSPSFFAFAAYIVVGNADLRSLLLGGLEESLKAPTARFIYQFLDVVQ
jgi:hypothetical protein